MTPPPSHPAKPPKKQDRPLALVNARIVDPASNRDEPGGILVIDGVIQEIGAKMTRANAPDTADIVDCRGQVLAPGLIDMRVQLREPGEEHKETIETASLAAAAGGVTTILEMPISAPPQYSAAILKNRIDIASRSSLVDFAFYGGAGAEHIDRIPELAVAGVVAFKDAALRLSQRRHGALVVFEQDTGLQEYIDTGVKLEAEPSPELFLTIFNKHTELHDGAIIIRGEKLAAAACVLPLSTSSLSDRQMGLRHRAALGISEVSDAVAVVVSEETGQVSIAHNGRILRRQEIARLDTILHAMLTGPRQPVFEREAREPRA